MPNFRFERWWDEAMKYIPIIVNGESMAPLYPHNLKLLLDTTCMDYQLGDIVVFKQSGRIVIHRLVQIFGNRIAITKGDHNTRVDRPIHLNQVLGKIVDIREGIDKIRVSQYSRFIAIICDRYGLDHPFSICIYDLFLQYLRSKTSV